MVIRMKKDKRNQFKTKYSIIISLALTIIYIILTVVTVNNRYEEDLKIFEKSTINIAESYSDNITKSKEAHDIISDLLESKLISVSTTVLSDEDYWNNGSLTEIAELNDVDEIYLYNIEGEIVFSNHSKYLGWKAYAGHPVHEFMLGEKDVLVGEIRQDTESGILYKYAYARLNDGRFIQVGILAEKYYTFFEKFETQNLINRIMRKYDIKNAFFIDSDGKVIGSSVPEYIDRQIQEELIINRISQEKSEAIRTVINGEEVFQACVPVYYDGVKLGTLSLGWSTEELDQQTKGIILNGIIIFIIVTVISNIILYYAFKNYKRSIKIAYYDKLTGLPNSEYLHEYLSDNIKENTNTNKAIMLIGISDLEAITLTYGNNYANEIVKNNVVSLKALCDNYGMLFRYSTARFVLVVNNYPGIKDLQESAYEIIMSYDELKHNDSIPLKLKIAIVQIEDQTLSTDEVLQEASLALSSIEGNKERVVIYHEEIQESINRTTRIEEAIRNTIEGKNDSLYLVYQPKLALKSNKCLGFEALARMYDDELGNVSPVEFISIAEKKTLMFELGNIIFKKACVFAKNLEVKGFDSIKIAVNISVIQLLRDEFYDSVRETISVTQVDPEQLVFEITESETLISFTEINEKLKEIREIGISVSIDDFGTGYSSFSRLRDLNVDEVKIDKSFIDRISSIDEKELLTSDIISMAHKMKLAVVAEGVEDDVQKEYLMRHDCDILQGYLYSRPLNEHDSLNFLIAER